MMDEIIVLDGNLQPVGLIDSYISLIWAKRYWATGDCELYVAATAESLSLLQKNRYMVRADDDMICRIKKIEVDTDAENGNYIIVTAFDVSSFLHQRIIWQTVTIDGNIEVAIHSLVNGALCVPLMDRALKKTNGERMFYLGNLSGLAEVTTEQISYKNLGQKIEEYCRLYGWGYRVNLDSEKLFFELYAGVDRRASVIFSDNYENLNATQYIEDETNMGNVALVGGQGEGAMRAKSIAGDASGVDRYEIFVDAKDISKTITWEELTAIYPPIESGGAGYIAPEGVTYVYKMASINIQVIDERHLRDLQRQYPDGILVFVDGNDYYQIYNVTIADIPSSAPEAADEVTLGDVIYSAYLINRGYEKLAEYGAVTSFDGSVDPETTFVYKRDYNIGDLVTIENEFGISVGARIIEIVEVNDDAGYKLDLKFEYIQEV